MRNGMALEVPVQPEMESRIRDEASAHGLPAGQLAARRLEEAELLWRIRTATPDSETRELHRLLRKRRAGTLNDEESDRLTALLDERESRAGQRLDDLRRLSQLSGMPLTALMDR